MEKDILPRNSEENNLNSDDPVVSNDVKDNLCNVEYRNRGERSSLENEKCEEKTEEIEEILSEDVKLQKQNDALEFKEEGNKEFRIGSYDVAADLYTKGLDTCPKSCSQTMAVLLANRGACYSKLDMNDPAIKDCTSAIEYDSYYTKARLRRAQLYEKNEKLDEALKDYNEILKYDRSCTAAGEAAMRLPGQINERNEKLKNEMFSKLKELGNTCLKPFGLSTDNFQVSQDPNSGGYSINFQK